MRIVPFPQRRSSAEQYLSHPQQILSGCFGLSANFCFDVVAPSCVAWDFCPGNHFFARAECRQWPGAIGLAGSCTRLPRYVRMKLHMDRTSSTGHTTGNQFLLHGHNFRRIRLPYHLTQLAFDRVRSLTIMGALNDSFSVAMRRARLSISSRA